MDLFFSSDLFEIETINEGTPTSFVTQGAKTDTISIGMNNKAFSESMLTPNEIRYKPAASEDNRICAV